MGPRKRVWDFGVQVGRLGVWTPEPEVLKEGRVIVEGPPESYEEGAGGPTAGF